MPAVEQITGYEDFELLERGEETARYRAKSVESGRPVAITVYFPAANGVDSAIERFDYELSVTRDLGGSGVVRALERGVSEGAQYFVYDYCDGVDLAELRSAHGPIPVDACCGIIVQISQVLELLHTAGVAHFDLRPGNVMLTPDGYVQLKGITKQLARGEIKPVLDAGLFFPRAPYVSPEELQGDDVDFRCDIYSLGVIAWELLGNRRPFAGETPKKLLSSVVAGAAEPIDTVNPLVEPPLAEVVTRMMHKHAGKRYLHVAEILMDMEEVVDRYRYASGISDLAAFLAEPDEYRDHYVAHTLQQLRKRPVTAESGMPADRVEKYLRKLNFLDPDDQDVVERLEAMGCEATPQADGDTDAGGAEALDRTASYRVYLDSLRPGVSVDGFALKLSLQMKTPLPRIKSLVARMPSQVSGTLPYEKAVRVSAMLQGLGGVTRLVAAKRQVHESKPEAAPESRSEAPDTRAPRREAPEVEKSEGARPFRRPEAGPEEPEKQTTRTCPSCGRKEPADAAFCGGCLHDFAPRRGEIDLRGRGVVEENPLETPPESMSLQWLWARLVAEAEKLSPTTRAVILVFVGLLVLHALFTH